MKVINTKADIVRINAEALERVQLLVETTNKRDKLFDSGDQS